MRNHLGKASVAQSLDGRAVWRGACVSPKPERYIELCVNGKAIEDGRYPGAKRNRAAKLTCPRQITEVSLNVARSAT
jgi:hypothetical protein